MFIFSARRKYKIENNDLDIHALQTKHFHPTTLQDLHIHERIFPFNIRADLQVAVNQLISTDFELIHFCGLRKEYCHEGIRFVDTIVESTNDPILSVPPQYEEIDIGGDSFLKIVKDGFWILKQSENPVVILLHQATSYGQCNGIRVEIATLNNEIGTKISESFFKALEKAIEKSNCYRGKILSLEVKDQYRGESSGIAVHKLKEVDRSEVILSESTLELLDRNVMRFMEHRPKLAKLGLDTKKGLLFYGPPGTGKTHTIHYISGALEGHTTFIITAEQIGLLGEYMTLARLLQPSIVVIEDVDLIAKDRTTMQSSCEEVYLNKLLNEMDGLKQDSEILFILTTNRPEALESALASRPGRIDQAIEFPLPDEKGREKLIHLYSRNLELCESVIKATVSKTENMSASFIKELMRRTAQFHLERDESSPIEMADVDNALNELLFAGGSLNQKLLGAHIDNSNMQD